MNNFVQKEAYTGPVLGVVMDWAGTAVDYGCLGPAAVFVKVFDEFGVTVTVKDARAFMGLEKKEHIRRMLGLDAVASAWKDRTGRMPEEQDVDRLYEKTAAMMVETITDFSTPIDGIVPMVEQLKAMGIKVGSSTGYVREMMDVLVPRANAMGYRPDAVFCSSDVPAGRPFPWMCYLNAIELQVYPMAAMVKIGDTVTDIEEGLNAGMWSVGVTRTGNELGLPEEEVAALFPADLTARLTAIETRFKQTGAHYVLESAADVLPVIQDINRRLEAGEQPLGVSLQPN